MRCTSAIVIVSSLLFLAASAFAQGTLSGTLGQGVNVQGNTATTINYSASGTSLVIQTDVACTVTLSILLKTDFTLDPTLSQYALGALASSATSIGYTLTVSNGANIVTATITSDALAVSFLSQLTGNVGGILYYDATTQGYLEIPPTITGGKATFSAPYKGSYVFVLRASTQPAAALFNRAVTIAANTQSSIQLHSATTSRLVITQTTSSSSTFTATESASAPSGVNGNAKGLVRISSFFDLNSSANTGINSNLQYTYTTADEAKADVRTLAWYYYNSASGSWDVDGTSSVDVNARVVTHASTHFSTWMVAAKSFSATMLPAALLAALALAAVLLV